MVAINRTVAINFARFSAATLGPLAIACSLSPFDYHVLGPVGFSIFLLSIWRAGVVSTVLLTSWSAFVNFLPVMSWLQIVGTEAWLFPSVLYAFMVIPIGFMLYFVLRVPGWPVWAASLWVLKESITDRFPWGGFGWGQVGYGQVGTPLASYAALGGAPLVTFTTCLLGGMLAYAAIWIYRYIKFRTGRPQELVMAPIVVCAVGVVALLIPLPVAGESERGVSSARITVVQGGPDEITGDDPALREFPERFRSHYQLTQDYAYDIRVQNLPAPDFIVWAEGSGDGQLLTNPNADRKMQKLVDYVGRPVLVGSGINPSGNGWVNASILWYPNSGPVDYYFKRHLVPFAEYTPLSGLARNVMDNFGLATEYVPGDEPGFFDIDGVAISTVICFEISSARVVREAVLEGGRAIVLQSSNYGFIFLGQAEQQFAIARLRAIEHGRTVIAAGISGPSGFIAPNGEVISLLEEGDVGVLSEIVPLRDSVTIADKIGGVAEGTLAFLWLFGIVIYVRQSRLGHRLVKRLADIAPADGAQT